MKNIMTLFKWGKKNWIYILVVMMTTIVLQFLYSFIPLFIRYGIQALEEQAINVNLPSFILDILKTYQDTVSLLLMLAIMMIVVQFIRSILRFTDSYLRGVARENIAIDMRNKMYSHVAQLSYTYQNNSDTGDLIQRCTSDIEASSTFIASRVPDIIHIIATISIGAYQVGNINMTLMWVSLCIIPISATASIIYFRYVNKKFEEIEKSESKLTTIIQENLSSVRVVKAFAAERFEIDKFDKQSKDYTKKNIAFSNVMALFWGSSDCTTMLQYVLTTGVAIYLAQTGQADASDIASCLLLMGMLIWPIRGLGRIISDFGKAIIAAKRIDEILAVPSEFDNDGTITSEIKGNIEFKHVSFKFDDDDKHLLSDVSFKIKAGQVVALVGKTGSGKSTIANLLTRLLDYDSGSILVDGIELKDYSKRHVRSNIGMVLQDPFLFSKTIYENISIASKNIGKEKIYEAANIAAIHEDILTFEQGYETIVGEKGTTLSGGQKQRVAIARMLTSNKPVIIFDDSLSAVDTETDLMIRKALKKKSKDMTMIIITHRSTTAKEADNIIVLDQGQIIENGTHEELVANHSLYAKLWEIQGRLEKEFFEVLGGEENGAI